MTVTSASRRLLPVHPRDLLVPVLGGAGSGAFAAWAYYDDLLRPLAHTFLLWTVLLATLAARRTRAAGAVVGAVALSAAVVAFYVGKDVVYGIEYPGMPYELNTSQLTLWLVLALGAGGLLGAVFAPIGTTGHRGAVALAAAVALLVADAIRRSSDYPGEGGVVWAAAALGAVSLLVAYLSSWRQLAVVLAWAVPLTVVGFVLVSAPDALEQVLVGL